MFSPPGSGKGRAGVDADIGVKAMETYIAGRFGHVPTAHVWSSQFAMSALTAKERETAAEIYARHREPSAAAMAAARAALGRASRADGELLAGTFCSWR